MTKQQELQKELLKKVKPGVKASDLKKLKKSKSADNLTPPAFSLPLTRSKSAQELEPIPTKEELENKVSVLNLEIEIKSRELTEKQETITVYSEQLKEKQKEVELLRKQKEKLNSQLTDTTAELDNSLIARYEALKTFSKIYDKLQLVKQELNENVNQASDELLNQDKTITNLRTNHQKAQAQIRELEKDLQLTSRLAQMRKVPYYSPDDNWNCLKYALYSLCAVGFTLWLTNNLKNKEIK